jgi:hypothetical protein
MYLFLLFNLLVIISICMTFFIKIIKYETLVSNVKKKVDISLNNTIPSPTINCNKTTNDNSKWLKLHMCENGTYKT